MAKATGILENIEGHLGDLSLFKRYDKTFVRTRHIHQPRRLSRKQLRQRERQSLNNILWKALKATGQVYFDGEKAPYYNFMSANTHSPVPYLTKSQIGAKNALLLPEMVVSDGPLHSIGYQIGEVDGQPALLTDLTKRKASKMTLLLYVLKQNVQTRQNSDDTFQVSIEVETLSTDDFVNVPSMLTSPYKDVRGTLALVGERYADPMLGFALVQVENGVASRQRVFTNCTYYQRYTTEEALQAAAKSYGGLTGE
jgi:hypothetical protein